MRTKRNFYESRNIHPNAPKRLVTALHKAKWNRRELARLRNVNHFYLSALLNEGYEPTDKTEKGRAARVALFLPAHIRKPRAPKSPAPAWLQPIKRGIRKMAAATKEAIDGR